MEILLACGNWKKITVGGTLALSRIFNEAFQGTNTRADNVKTKYSQERKIGGKISLGPVLDSGLQKVT